MSLYAKHNKKDVALKSGSYIYNDIKVWTKAIPIPILGTVVGALIGTTKAGFRIATEKKRVKKENKEKRQIIIDKALQDNLKRQKLEKDKKIVLGITLGLVLLGGAIIISKNIKK